MDHIIPLNDSWKLYSDLNPAVVCATVDHPMDVWSQVFGWIDKATNNEWSLIGANDVFNDLLRHAMTLWTIRDHGNLVGAYVTKVECGSKGKALNIIALGGIGMADWIASFDRAVSIYAREHRCAYIFEMGRPGWRRVLDPLGWWRGPATMVKVL
jgi:hypothetical protein